MSKRSEVRGAVLKAVKRYDSGATIDQIVAMIRLDPCCDDMTRDDVAYALKALRRAGRLTMGGEAKLGGYRYGLTGS